MSDLKLERQLNLLFVLINANRPIEKNEIRLRVPGYLDKSELAFERMFARDKDDLRELGIPIETKFVDVLHEDQFGYFVNRDEWQLPEISFSPEERSLLNAASSAWHQSQIGMAVDTAVERLTERMQIDQIIQLDISRQSSYLEIIFQAFGNGKCLEFTYFSRNKNTQELRLVAPWRVFLSEGRGYLIGFDQDKGEMRVFRLSRIVGSIALSDELSLEPIPENLSAAKIVENWVEEDLIPEVILEIKKNKAGELRLQANETKFGEVSDQLIILKKDHDQIVKLISKNCGDIKIISPLTLRDDVNRVLTASSRFEK